ncbi:hypothetical protein LXA43DRAFT_1078607 [Ganoderma leucocontextum]|nr:hypothetical protein LXA43DRAFT_1078607 [Ganoderma leucocontextum]
MMPKIFAFRGPCVCRVQGWVGSINTCPYLLIGTTQSPHTPLLDRSKSPQLRSTMPRTIDIVPPSPYLNQKQRDIHIWASLGLTKQPVLLAGVWSNQGRLTYDTLHEWLEKFVLVPSLTDLEDVPPPVSQSKGKICRYFLVSFEDILKANLIEDFPENPDPRELFSLRLSATKKALKQDPTLLRLNDTNPCKSGHYILFGGEFKAHTNEAGAIITEPESLAEITYVAPAVYEKTMFSDMVDIVQQGAGTRSESTRTSVRTRDKCCQVSRLKAMKRERGTDYTALEVAHVFPLALAEKAVDFLKGQKLDEVLSYARTRKGADRPQNAILLRSDLHRFFDQYQWSIYKGKIYAFETMYPTVLDDFFDTPVTLAPEVSEAVVLHHFRTCIGLRVVGMGFEGNYIL